MSELHAALTAICDRNARTLAPHPGMRLDVSVTELRRLLAAHPAEPATPPAGAVEADEARELRLDLQACHATLEAVALALREEADDIGANDPAADFLNKWADRIQPAAPEPTPEQVEAPARAYPYPEYVDPAVHVGCPVHVADPEQVEADLAQDEQAHARYYADGDAIDALAGTYAGRLCHKDNSASSMLANFRDFAARILEVGGQQPGVPVEKVREVAETLLSLANAAEYQKPKYDDVNAVWREAARQVAALLKEEPTS